MATISTELSNALLAFSFDVYKQLLAENSGSAKNVVVSPFSIATALSMTLAGARGRTAHEITRLLHTAEFTRVDGQFWEFLTKVSSFAPDVTLELANRLYVEETYSILEEYIASLKKFYGSSVAPLSFKTAPETARLAVNDWVEGATKSKIKDLLPSGAVNCDTALVLVNAIYFKGLWNDQFNPRFTSQSQFHTSKNSVKNVDMMFREGRYRVNEDPDGLKASAIEIPYKGGKTSMVILLPDDVEELAELEASLTPGKIADFLKGLGSRVVELRLPRFKVELETNLKETLQSMGLESLFSESADLSGIDGKGELTVTAAVHKAFVEVNEEGTEAAAASAMVATNRCARFVVSFTVDRPFVFLIRSHDPNIVLFIGSVRDI
ncbi:iris-like isoform X3 [Haemaphysalis longicornis]